MQYSARKIALPFFLWILAWIPVSLAAQSASFTVSQNGKSVGTASYSFAPADQTLQSSSIVRVSMQGLDYSISKTEELSQDRQLRLVQLSAIVNNSAVAVHAAPAGSQLVLEFSANGRKTSTPLPNHTGAVFLPDFDPGALENLLALAATNNNRDLWAIVPKQSGSIQPIQLATYADESGTLDGQPIAVHHLIATIAEGVTDLFTSPDNHLLQAELPQKGFSLVRQGFVLTPPKRPGAPPPAQPSTF